MAEIKPAKFYEIKKIDAHMHLNNQRNELQNEATNEGFSLVTINTEVPFFPPITEQKVLALKCGSQIPGTLDFITTFSTGTLNESDWHEQAIEQIRQGLEEGAVGVKIWKNVGMELRDKDGNFVMADHPTFDPVYEFLSDNAIPLLAHLGEPKNCWLPVDEMTVTSDRDYFSNHPRYHMYLHKEYPSYEDQLQARDHVLAKHPRLKFVGAHLASLEWSVDRLAGWFDKHPGVGIDLAERVCHLQHQAVENHSKVKEFVEHYQDRIIYGSDQIDDGSLSPEAICKQIRHKWRGEYRFFAENGLQSAWNVEKPFHGLGLDRNVLQKLFRENAIRYYPRLNTG